ncbi:ATP-binding protein [Variovorax sp. GT1P44]|uniref:ATP-binding protein n=1 Tax=Variovorax sp. GT1P44 TaxID=3443742 RepID=UPI003F45EA01
MDFLTVLRKCRALRWLGPMLAIVLPTLGLATRIAIGDSLKGYPYLTFFPAVIATALLGSRWSAVLATVLSASRAQRFAGYGDDEMGWWLPISGSDWIGISLFAGVCTTIIVLVHLLSEALARLTVETEKLEELNNELERRVQARTVELEKSNTELRAQIQARELAEAKARQAQKMEAIGQLTGGIAHDFNNMLAVVIGNLDLALRRLAIGQTDILKYLDGALDGARRGAKLTQRLLAFSRQQPLQPIVADVNALVHGMEELLRRTLGETVVHEFVLGGGLWRTRVDPGQLENALLNLAVNARDAMPGGGKLTIETMNTHLDDAYAAQNDVPPGQYVMVAVSDTGCGMPPQILERAFDPFFTTKKVGQGTGLGLSQVYGFVKQSGGHVKIYSETGQGTTVKVYLRRELSAASAGRVEEGAEAAVPVGSPQEIILVVEDEPDVRKVSVFALRSLGYTVRHAGSGKEALDLLEELRGVSLLFTDVVMPGMTGRQLVDAALVRQPGLKVLYTTGYTPNAIVHSGVMDPGVELLTKPFTVDQLARKVRRLLD